MNRYNVHFFILMLIVPFCAMNAMENEQKISMIERKTTLRALATLSFADNEKILHIGPHREQIIRDKAEGAQIYCINTETLSCLHEPAQKYDKVLSFACWDIIKDPKKAFIDSARLLKSNGQFCAVLPYYESPYLDAHYSVITNDKWKNQFNKDVIADIYGSKQIKKLLIQAGISDRLACTTIKKPFTFKNKEALIAWIQSSAEQLDGIALEHQEEFINDVVARYLQKHPLEEDNSVKLYLPYMIVSGCKF